MFLDYLAKPSVVINRYIHRNWHQMNGVWLVRGFSAIAVVAECKFFMFTRSVIAIGEMFRLSLPNRIILNVQAPCEIGSGFYCAYWVYCVCVATRLVSVFCAHCLNMCVCVCANGMNGMNAKCVMMPPTPTHHFLWPYNHVLRELAHSRTRSCVRVDSE